MREAKLQNQFTALDLRTVTNTGDFQLFGKTVRNPGKEVCDISTCGTPKGTGALAIVGRFHNNLVVFL